MTDGVENIILEHLRSLRDSLRDFQCEVRQDFKDLKQRVSSVESAVLGGRREHLATQEDLARHQISVDALTDRVQRIERRLDIHG